MTRYATADLCDRYSDQEHFQIGEPLFKRFGQQAAFHGQITTLRVFEDNTLVRQTLQENVENRILVIDGGGSHRCALLGENLAQMAVNNGWNGIIVYGCIRDSDQINQLPIGIRALNTHPLKSRKPSTSPLMANMKRCNQDEVLGKHGHGERDIMITFAGINFRKDHFLYADNDGIIVSDHKLG